MQAASTFPPMQRSHGAAMLRFRAGVSQARLADLSQKGSAKAILPRSSGAPEVVFLNTSGGLTDGDSLSYELHLGDHCRVTATTQTAERAYASRGTPACVRVQATVGAGGRLDWLPQETILFEASNLHRSTVIDLADTAETLMLETILLGRPAMGEHPAQLRLQDHRMIRRNARPVWTETFALDAEILASCSDALLGETRAFAVIAFVGSNAQDSVAPLRAILDQHGCVSAASGWDGRCLVRIAATDGWVLRQQVIRALAVLRPDPPPRVWQC